MFKTLARLALVPLALAMASTALLAPPSGAVTGKNIVEDFEHEYVGLVAFYDAEGVFLHRCSGTLLSAEVFLTAGHCVAGDDEGNVAALARIWFEQDAGVGYDPVTGTPAPSGYPVSGGVTSTCSTTTASPTSPPSLRPTTSGSSCWSRARSRRSTPRSTPTAASAPVGAADDLGTGIDAVVTVSGYGVTRTNGKNGNNTVSYRERLMGQTFIINTRNPDTAGYNLQLASNPGGGRVGTCFGDSGGPMFAGDTTTVLAVNSWVKNWSCGGQGFPYRVDTAEVQEWMESVLAPLGLWDDVAPE